MDHRDDARKAADAEEALRRAEHRKDEFLALLAHELRNPLGPIRNGLEVLKIAGPKISPLVEARAMMERQLNLLVHIVDDLLDVSRIARGRIHLERVSCDLTQIARQTAEDHRATLEAHGVALTVRVPGEPIWIEGDPTRLAQAIGNLLHNARKFTDPGGQVTLSLERAQGAGGGREAILCVRDTGIGLEPDMLARIFDPLGLADDTLERRGSGAGLGLALVKGLVELHGGAVRASSEGLGRGTEIAIRLPAQPAPGAPAERPSARAAVPASRRVLLIEDNVDAAESMRMLLDLLGHEVAVAHDGPAGLEAARRLKPEIVLCDIGLPDDMDGYEVARAFRRDPEIAKTYLVALTGYGQQEDQERARAAGFDLHAVKPVDLPLLEQVLATA